MSRPEVHIPRDDRLPAYFSSRDRLDLTLEKRQSKGGLAKSASRNDTSRRTGINTTSRRDINERNIYINQEMQLLNEMVVSKGVGLTCETRNAPRGTREGGSKNGVSRLEKE